jgi:N-acetylmuramoyl-L-alanine amidase
MGASLRSFGNLFRVKKYLALAGATAATLIGGTVTFFGHLDALQARYEKWSRDSEYERTLRRPYPGLLTSKDIEGWSSGRLQLAELQIDAYLGRLKSSPSWIKQCLRDPAIFPKDYGSQYNDRLDLEETYIDRSNREIIRQRLDKIQADKIEDADIYRTPDPFARLLKRASVQLLSAYKESEIAILDKAELYLLRNAIYGQHGYKFDTPKLRKFANRRGWSAASATFKTADVSPLEVCNAYFLEQVHPIKELGALGRGVLIRKPDSPLFPAFLKPWLCTCLGQAKFAMECRESVSDPRDEFHDFVDLIVEFQVGQAIEVEWSFLDSRYVSPADFDHFKRHQDKLVSAAVDFNAQLHKVFQSRNVALVAAQHNRRGVYWGAKLTLSADALQQLASDPTFLREATSGMCNGIRDVLELAGPFIPRTVGLVAARVDPSQPTLEIYDKPIVFDDLRIKLTKEYVLRHYGVVEPGIDLRPVLIVVDWTDTATLEQAYEKFRPSLLPASRKSAAAPDGEVNYSAHYLIDRDGTVFSLMKDFEIARHTVGLDRQALAIANVGSATVALTPAQAEATAQLVRFLTKKYGAISVLIGASEYGPFVGTSLWEEKDPLLKPDPSGPSAEFLRRLRARLSDVRLRSTPEPTGDGSRAP